MKHLMLFLAGTALLTAQPAQPVPFASAQNILRLTIVNEARVSARELVVRITAAPSWIRFDQAERSLAALGAGETTDIDLAFTVDRGAPVRIDGIVRLSVLSAGGERWERQLRITVLPPETYELFQNFPNPFNPATTIAYQLPEEARVRLRICDVIGREIGTIDEGLRAPGYHRVRFDAGACASGLYLCLLETVGPDGLHRAFRRAMLLVR